MCCLFQLENVHVLLELLGLGALHPERVRLDRPLDRLDRPLDRLDRLDCDQPGLDCARRQLVQQGGQDGDRGGGGFGSRLDGADHPLCRGGAHRLRGVQSLLQWRILLSERGCSLPQR
jgi:hypothetical protein